MWAWSTALWMWFTELSVWFFLGFAVLFILVLALRDKITGRIKGMASERWLPLAERCTSRALWIIELLSLIIIIGALVAIVLSEEGVYTIITPETIEQWLLEHGGRILVMLAAGVILWLSLNRFLPPLVQRFMTRPIKGESRQGRKKRADTLVRVFMGTGKAIIVVIIIFMVLSEFTVDIGPILAGLGVVGIAVGFGAQYLIRDLIAGVFILLENQYRVGDVAKVASITGLVEEVNLRKTVLRDLDGIVHHIPNGEITVASNYTRHFSRVNLDIPVAYGTDLGQAITIINRVCQELATDTNWQDKIISTPQVLRVNNLGDSGIEIKILGDVKPLEQWAIMGELRLRIKNTFDEEGIEIPWPHTKVYFGNSPEEFKK